MVVLSPLPYSTKEEEEEEEKGTLHGLDVPLVGHEGSHFVSWEEIWQFVC